jgi:threonylcarbamoyladenosine tRNA methylthiotransferase MtaB
MVVIIMYHCTIPLARGISRSDELENVLKNASEISKQNIKKLFLPGILGITEKENLEIKTRTYFLRISSELDKSRRNRKITISSIEPNLLKNETIEFVSKSRTFVPHFSYSAAIRKQ